VTYVKELGIFLEELRRTTKDCQDGRSAARIRTG